MSRMKTKGNMLAGEVQIVLREKKQFWPRQIKLTKTEIPQGEHFEILRTGRKKARRFVSLEHRLWGDPGFISFQRKPPPEEKMKAGGGQRSTVVVGQWSFAENAQEIDFL